MYSPAMPDQTISTIDALQRYSTQLSSRSAVEASLRPTTLPREPILLKRLW